MSKEIKPSEAFHDKALFDIGIGNVALLRFKNSGVHAAVFLIDVYCLGVKDVFSTVASAAQYPQPLLGRIFRNGVAPLSPGSARHLVEGAVNYAARFGFHPHPEYQKVRTAFAGIEVDAGARSFEFGHEGKPLFVAGPNETPQRCDFILAQLQKVCGEGNYHYLVPVGEMPGRF